MSDLFWDRRVRLTLGDNSGAAGNAMLFGADPNCTHRIDFDITKTRDSTKNSGTIEIYNLSSDERNLVDDEYERILLNVGYQGDYPADAVTGFWSDLVDGWVHKVTHEQSGRDIITRIEYVEGKFANNLSQTNIVADSGTPYRSIVRRIVEQAMPNITIEDISGIPSDSVVVRGRARTFSGQSMDEIAKIARNHDARATIDNNKLQIISNDTGRETRLGVPVFSAETGLIGRASKTEKGVTINTFLYPHIRPNMYFIVRDELIGSGTTNKNPVFPQNSNTTSSRNTSGDGNESSESNVRAQIIDNYIDGVGGVFRANKVVFRGSNRSSRFTTQIDGQSFDGAKVVRPLIDYSPVAKVIPTQEVAN